jgi:glutamate-1-semialdehyde 2,1-aminomutase
MRETDRRYVRSEELLRESSRFLAGGVSSNFRLTPISPPLFFERAEGAYLYDVDGNAYVDYVLGMGPVLLGHAPPDVTEAVAATLADGQLYAGQHPLETALARLVCELVPGAELVRFGLSGSEMVQLALRLARAWSGRSRVIKFEGHYHGWFDTILVSVAPPLDGLDVPHLPSGGQSEAAASDVAVLPWNDLEAVDRHLTAHGAETAALMMEPILCNTCVVLPAPGYLEGVRRLCDEHGVALIFDEVITGFRVAPGGAQELLGVTADLAIYAKAIGGGFPVAALTGRRDLMELAGDGRVLHGGTYNTNLVSTAAAHAVLETVHRDGATLYPAMEAQGARLLEELRSLAAAQGIPLHVQGLPTVFNTCFLDVDEITDYRSYSRQDAARQQAFLRALQAEGVRVTARGTWFMSAAHGDTEIDRTLEAAEASLAAL